MSMDVLREARGTALRRRVWYRVLDGIERGIVNLTISVVEGVRSPTLFRELSKILVKLREALKNAFTRHLEEYGYRKALGIIKIALSFGNEEALRWEVASIAKLLAVNNYNDPVGWMQVAG
jgi:hypothetical protein